MKGFAGFTHTRDTPVPSQFFSELLPQVDHLGELKVTLYALWSVQRAPNGYAPLARDQFARDGLLMEGLGAGGLSADEALEDALERARARGTLLKVTLELEGRPQEFYFLNDLKGRSAVEAVESGEWRPSGEPGAPVELRMERPNIFNLYEQNIGPLTPMIADSLRDAERSFPEQWIAEAIQIAVENNVRKWRYVEAILDDWQASGRKEHRGDTERARQRYRQGDFWDT